MEPRLNGQYKSGDQEISKSKWKLPTDEEFYQGESNWSVREQWAIAAMALWIVCNGLGWTECLSRILVANGTTGLENDV